MEKKFKFSENPTLAKSIYGIVIAVLCITAIVVGIVAANNRKKDTPANENPPTLNGDSTDNEENNSNENPDENKNPTEEKLSFISPVSGRVFKAHSISIPAYSATLEAWKIHTGIDISTEEGADVFAAGSGEVTKVYSHPMLGNTVEITHANGMVSRYSNLSSEALPTVGLTVDSGAKIGSVGDSAISEIADEPHLHFEMLLNNTSVNPLDYISEDSKKASLEINEGEAA